MSTSQYEFIWQDNWLAIVIDQQWKLITRRMIDDSIFKGMRYKNGLYASLSCTFPVCNNPIITSFQSMKKPLTSLRSEGQQKLD